MKLLHQVWHNWKRNLESYFEHKIWDWFIFNAYSFSEEKIWQSISWYKFDEFKNISLLDLQFFWWNSSISWWNLSTYPFHPTHSNVTLTSETDLIFKAIDYQIDKGFNKIIIPNAHYKIDETDKILNIVKKVNLKLKDSKKDWFKYYMTIPISNEILGNEALLEMLLLTLTNIDIVFDWYYITCESKIQTRKKINDSFSYYYWLYEVLNTLKLQNFELIYSYSNFDSLIFFSLVDIDYISIWTYENLRNFDVSRFKDDSNWWWPSKWWYFSEKLLNMIKADELINIRKLWWLDLIRNDDNIFSDEILTDWYIWNTHKPQIHKNYLLSISNTLVTLSKYSIEERKKIMIDMIENAKKLYLELESKNIFLFDESSDYHLNTWLSFLKSK